MNIIPHLIETLIECLLGWILIEKVPAWLRISGFFATIIRIIGVLIILSAILSWLH